MNSGKSNFKSNIVIMILLIIIIILLLLFNLNDNEDKKALNQTGNVDIFDILCDKNCNCSIDDEPDNDDDDDDDKNNAGDNSDFNGNNSSGGNSNNMSSGTGNFEAYDDTAVWQSTNNLRIFENPIYDNDSVIAPLSTNSYKFVIRNSTSYEVNYKIDFTEENKHNINMKYRLKKNNNYVVGSDSVWVTYSELELKSNNIGARENDTFILEWKWFESDNDTLVGTLDSSYTLNINLSAVQVS